MGFFSYLFGTSSSTYSQHEYPITELEIQRLISRAHIPSLSQSQQHLVEHLIAQRRHSDAKISLRQIDEVLRKLKYENKISDIDRRGVMRVFEEFFKSRIGM